MRISNLNKRKEYKTIKEAFGEAETGDEIFIAEGEKVAIYHSKWGCSGEEHRFIFCSECNLNQLLDDCIAYREEFHLNLQKMMVAK